MKVEDTITLTHIAHEQLFVQPTDRPTDRPTNQPTNQPTNRPTNQPTNHVKTIFHLQYLVTDIFVNFQEIRISK